MARRCGAEWVQLQGDTWEWWLPALLLAGCILCHFALLTRSLAKAAFTLLCLIEGLVPAQLLFC